MERESKGEERKEEEIQSVNVRDHRTKATHISMERQFALNTECAHTV